MDANVKEIIWRQYGAAIDMLTEALQNCPPELWEARMYTAPEDLPPNYSSFWYTAFHTLFWMDLDMSGRVVEGFQPPAPFTLDELDPAGIVPPVYSKEELLGYAAYCREKARAMLLGLTDAQAKTSCRFGGVEAPFAELLLYSMRHVQEHGGQLSLFLGQNGIDAGRWVAVARE